MRGPIAEGRQIVLQLELASGALGGHRTDDAKDRPFRPGPIVKTEHPTVARIGNGIASVERISVHQLLHHGKSALRSVRPLENLLAPEHPHVAVKPAFT